MSVADGDGGYKPGIRDMLQDGDVFNL
jgi:hypothetical protein